MFLEIKRIHKSWIIKIHSDILNAVKKKKNLYRIIILKLKPNFTIYCSFIIKLCLKC